jgi:hypothetical protein
MVLNDVAFIECAYLMHFGRAVDPNGLASALKYLAAGGNRDQWLASLSFASQKSTQQELNSFCESLPGLLGIMPTTIFVRRSLTCLTGAEPADLDISLAVQTLNEGIPRWEWLVEFRRLSSGSGHRARLKDVHLLDISGAETLGLESTSLKRLQSVTNEGFVQLAYRAILGREPDSGGRAGLVAAVESGRSRVDLLLGLAMSDEGKAGEMAGRAIVYLGLPCGLISRSALRIRLVIHSLTRRLSMCRLWRECVSTQRHACKCRPDLYRR